MVDRLDSRRLKLNGESMKNGELEGFLKTELRLRTGVDSIRHLGNEEDSVFHVSICTYLIFIIIFMLSMMFLYLFKCNLKHIWLHQKSLYKKRNTCRNKLKRFISPASGGLYHAADNKAEGSVWYWSTSYNLSLTSATAVRLQSQLRTRPRALNLR